LALDSISLANLLVFFPGIQDGLDAALKDAMDKVAKPGFQHSKERFILAEVFLANMPNLKQDVRKNLVALIEGAGNFKELKDHLKNWESSTSTTGGSSSFWTSVISFFSSKEQTSKYFEEAASQSRNMKDKEFLATLLVKVSKEPLLEQLAQDVITKAHGYFQEFMKRRLPRLHSQAHVIKRQTMYHQVDAEANDQDQKRRVSARSNWFNEIKTGQPQVDSGYVQYVTR
jgi:hypothetical protein